VDDRPDPQPAAAPAPAGGLLDGLSPPQQLAIKAVLGALKVSARVTPRPTAFAIRKLFERTGAQTASGLRRHAPVDVVVVPNERYGDGPDDVADIYVPARAAQPGVQLPTVVWVHGGAFVGGSKDELAGWFRLLADQGFCVVAPTYTLAPAGRYPSPLRQVMALLTFLQRDPARLHVDPARLVLAGDSAGASIAGQAAALVTNPAYAEAIGVPATITAGQLKAVVLCCGIYDVTAVDPGSFFSPFLTAVMWAYSGVRRWSDDHAFVDAFGLAGQVTAAYPPAFVTAGNADPLAPQSEALVDRLRVLDVTVDALLYPPDHTPALGHEYQFDLDTADARAAVDRINAFLLGVATP
jgi:acetyl esterase